MVHIGHKIEEILRQQRIPVSEFAEKINRSRTVIYHIFKRQSIDTNLLMKISTVLKHDFFKYFSESSLFIVEETGEKYLISSSKNENLSNELTRIKSENNELKEKVNLLKKINSFLEKSKKKK